MKAIWLSLVCFGLGYLVGYQVLSVGNEVADAARGAQKVSDQKVLETRIQRIEDLERQVAQQTSIAKSLKKELRETRRALAEKVAPVAVEPPVDEAEDAFMANVQTMATDMMQVQKSEELDKLKRTLSLTPEQLQAVEAFYAEEAEQQDRIMQEMFSGKPIETIQAEMVEADIVREHHSISSLLEAVLTPEQLATHEANEQTEALEQKEALAYSRLSQIQRKFVLDEAQKDAVFAIYYEAEHKVDSDEWASLGIDASDPSFSIQLQTIQNERLLESLAGVLSEDQFAAQKQALDAEVEMQRKAMNLFGQGFTGPEAGD